MFVLMFENDVRENLSVCGSEKITKEKIAQRKQPILMTTKHYREVMKHII